MAGDWIKAEKATPRKLEILRIADILGIHPDHAFGLCFRFWCWCDDQLENGNALGVTETLLDVTLSHEGFANSLITVGWLTVRNGSLSVPNFDRHLSENAKKRANSGRRVAKHRSENGNARSVTKALPEKRREEKSNSELSKDNSQASKSPSVKFAKPTVVDVREFCANRQNGIDPEAFIAHYESNGWRVGKNPMKDWRQAVVTWEKNKREFSNGKIRPGSQSVSAGDRGL